LTQVERDELVGERGETYIVPFHLEQPAQGSTMRPDHPVFLSLRPEAMIDVHFFAGASSMTLLRMTSVASRLRGLDSARCFHKSAIIVPVLSFEVCALVEESKLKTLLLQ
jgi:hypothetical protein